MLIAPRSPFAMQQRPLIRTSRLALGIVVGRAWRAVFRHKVRSALSALGIAIGIAAVVWVVALAIAGAERSAEQLRALGDNLVWKPFAIGSSAPKILRGG